MKAFRKPIALLVALLMAIIPFCGFAEAGPVRTSAQVSAVSMVVSLHQLSSALRLV